MIKSTILDGQTRDLSNPGSSYKQKIVFLQKVGISDFDEKFCPCEERLAGAEGLGAPRGPKWSQVAPGPEGAPSGPKGAPLYFPRIGLVWLTWCMGRPVWRVGMLQANLISRPLNI